MDLQKLSIEAALKRDWKSAISYNLQIIKTSPQDAEAYNRLGRAYLEIGQKNKALSIYQKVLRIDKFNTIAQKNISLIKSSKILRTKSLGITDNFFPAFLEEPGLTKNVSLIRVGDPKIISRLRPGDPVFLIARDHCVSVISAHQEYLGRLPDDIASRIRRCIKGGNKYSAWIKSIDINTPERGKQNLKIFIRETFRSPAFKDIHSFPLTEKLSYAAFTPPELIHEEKPSTSSTEEDVGETAKSDSELESDITADVYPSRNPVDE